MNYRTILAIALGLITSSGAFAAELLVKQQVEAKLVKLDQQATVAKLAVDAKLVQTWQPPAPTAPVAPPPTSREARFKALYGESAGEDEAAIRGLLAKNAGPASQPVARASETAPGIRGLLNKPVVTP